MPDNINKKFEVMIIGAGIAGSQCALWLKKFGHNPLLIGQSNKIGGLQTINPYLNDWLICLDNKTGIEVAETISYNLEKNSINLYYDQQIKNLEILADYFIANIENNLYQVKFLVIATGTNPKSGGLKEKENIIIGPGIKIENYNFSGKKVAILGGGDNAMENYQLIAKKNPQLLHIYARHIRARNNLLEQVNKRDLFIGDYQVQNQNIIYNNHRLNYDALVVLYGWEANIPGYLQEIKNPLIDDSGFIKVDEYRKTAISNIYAIGDVTHKTHPSVATAMADGVIAAINILKNLEK